MIAQGEVSERYVRHLPDLHRRLVYLDRQLEGAHHGQTHALSPSPSPSTRLHKSPSSSVTEFSFDRSHLHHHHLPTSDSVGPRRQHADEPRNDDDDENNFDEVPPAVLEATPILHALRLKVCYFWI
jgi:hypothetical protein